jgi:hypothetical protein
VAIVLYLALARDLDLLIFGTTKRLDTNGTIQAADVRRTVLSVKEWSNCGDDARLEKSSNFTVPRNYFSCV